MEFDAVAYLAAKGHRGKPVSGGREIVYACFFDCNEPANSSKKKLYVNRAEGLYDCKVCGASGGNRALQQHFGDTVESPRDEDDPYLRRRILDLATERGQEILKQNDQALLYLMNERGPSPATIATSKLGFIAGGWSLAEAALPIANREQLKRSGLLYPDGAREGRDVFTRHLLIPLLSRGHTVQIRGRAWGEIKGGKYFTPPGERPRVFNSDSLDGAEDVIVTEGEYDAIILRQALLAASEPRAHRIAVVGLPGTNAIPEDFQDLLSDLKRIYLGFDSDEPGKRAAEALKEILGTRARMLVLPYDNGRKCDWTEFLLPKDGPGSWATDHPYAGHDWRDVLRLLSTASGKRIFSVAEAGEAFRAYRSVNDGLKTGYKQLDYTLKPGLLPGQVMVVLAKTGTGKTLFLCNLAVMMRRHRILFLSLEMTREEVYERLARIYWFHHPRASVEELEAALANIYVCDENRLGERDISGLVSEFGIEAGQPPEVVLVDYLGYFARGARGNSPYEKTTNAVMQLKADAKAGRFVIISPSQVNRVAKEGKPIDLDDARDSGAIEETADFLLALFKPDEALSAEEQQIQSQSGKVKLSVLKSRHGGKGSVFQLQMDALTLAIVDDATNAAHRAQDHNRLRHERGWDWDDLRRDQTKPEQLAL